MGFSKESEEKRKHALATRKAAVRKAAKLKAQEQAAQNLANYEAGGEQSFLNKVGSSIGLVDAKYNAPEAAAGDGMSGGQVAGLAKMGLEGITGKSVGSNVTGDESGMDETTGGVDGAISGAMTGASVGGVPGAIIGGVAGAVQGAAAARAAAKAHNRQVEAKKHQALAEIEMRKGQQMSSAIQGMAGRMRIT